MRTNGRIVKGLTVKNKRHERKLFENCANKFNDPSLKPIYNAYFDLHEDFLVSHDLLESEEQSSALVTPDKIEEKLATVRVKVSTNSTFSHV